MLKLLIVLGSLFPVVLARSWLPGLIVIGSLSKAATPSPTITVTPTPTLPVAPTPTPTPDASRSVVAYYAANQPTIDGDISDWPAMPTVYLNAGTASTIEGERPSTVDNSATLRVAWNAGTLFFAIHASDDVLVADSADVWRDDGIELGIDGNFDRVRRGPTDHQYTLVIDERYRDSAIEFSGATLRVRSYQGGYDMEFAVPASHVLGANFQADSWMGFTWAIHDDDDGGQWETWMIWAGSQTVSGFDQFGQMLLSPTTISFGTLPDAPDAFEEDDACYQSRAISTDGVDQRHTFHDVGDVDWLRFTAEAHKVYVIETDNVGLQHDAVLFLYSGCFDSPVASQDNAFGRTLHLEWYANTAGIYYIKLQQHNPSVAGDATFYHIGIKRDTSPPAPPPSLRAAAVDEGLAIQWRRSPDSDVAGYRVWFGTRTQVYSGVDLVTGADATYYELGGLKNGTIYYVAVDSFDSSGNYSIRSFEISAVPEQPSDQTRPSPTVNQPTAGANYTTTLGSLTISGVVEDLGNNLSRVLVRSGSHEWWDYSLEGSSDTFQIENVTLLGGENSIEVTAFDAVGNEGSTTVRIHRLTSNPGAVIILAGHNETFSLQTNIDNAANRAYRVFQGAGFRDEDIYFLASTSQDPDGDGIYDEVDGPANPSKLQQALTTWALQDGRVGPGKPLYLYLMDHGEVDFFCAAGCAGPGRLLPRDLNIWLDSLEAATGADQINVIIEACHSGSFIDRVGDVVQSISKPGRVVITSTNRVDNAYGSADGAYFSDAFFSCIAASGSLKTCFDQARAAVVTIGQRQIPWLDDNGDSLYSALDGGLAQGRYVTRFFGASPPQITAARVTRQTGSGILEAEVAPGSDAVELVWAAVFAPSFEEPSTTTLDLSVPLVALGRVQGQASLYRVVYPGAFAEPGVYRVVFYAKDDGDGFAQPYLVTNGALSVYLPLTRH